MFNQIELMTRIGLDDKEARVYTAALRIGKASVEQLSKEAGILRTTTYHQIESLMQKGLMSSYTVGKKNFYTAESPTNLSRLLDTTDQKTRENRSFLADALPELISTFSKSGDRPIVRFFPGKEGLTTMREEVLQMEGKELLIVSTYEKFLNVFEEKERVNFSARRNDKNIQTRVLYTSDPTKNPLGYKPKQFAPKNVRILPDVGASIGFDIYLYDNKLCLSSLEGELWGVMIVGAAISESVRVLYEIAWLNSKPI